MAADHELTRQPGWDGGLLGGGVRINPLLFRGAAGLLGAGGQRGRLRRLCSTSVVTASICAAAAPGSSANPTTAPGDTTAASAR